jgi:hypothetical protein
MAIRVGFNWVRLSPPLVDKGGLQIPEHPPHSGFYGRESRSRVMQLA